MTREDAAIQPTGEAAVGSRTVSPDGLRMVWWWGPVAVYAFAILIGASIPQASVPKTVSDATLHGWGYAGFTVVIARALARGRWRHLSGTHTLASILIATMYGFAMEVYQLFVPGRFFDMLDVRADAIGAAAAGAAVLLATRAHRMVTRPHSSSP